MLHVYKRCIQCFENTLLCLFKIFISIAMSPFDIEKFYLTELKKDDSAAIATLRTLIQFLKEDKSATASELDCNVKLAIEKLKKLDVRIEVESVAQMYFRFITLGVSKFDVSFLVIENIPIVPCFLDHRISIF